MPDQTMCRLLPDLSILAQELAARGCPCHLSGPEVPQSFTDFHIFTGSGPLQPDTLYLLPPQQAAGFPGPPYSCVTAGGLGPPSQGLHCPDRSFEEVFLLLREVFNNLREFEAQMNALLFRNADLQALCLLGSRLLGNPLCIHDDWFQFIAGADAQGEGPATPPGSLPAELKPDAAYLEDFEQPGAQRWRPQGPSGQPECIYVNLRAGGLYRGRLLCMQVHRPFRRLDELLCQCLGQRALLLLQQEQQLGHHRYRSMDQQILALLEGKAAPDPVRLPNLLRSLGWQSQDRYMCIRLQAQQPMATVVQYAVHIDLFSAFSRSYIMFLDAQQCVVVNLSREGLEPADARHHISALCRDYALYAGLSSPCGGLAELPKTFVQAGVALEQAFYLHSEQWVIPFSSCALDYILRNLHTDLPAGHLIAPELLLLLKHDRDRGTQYFPTLRMWLLCERNIPRTSQALIIHRSTLLYRLERIRELTQVDLDDPNRRLYLLLSLRILEDQGS